MTPELETEVAGLYMSQVGVLRWMVELGRIDIITEVSLLASHSAMPRQGHFEAMIHLHGHLANNHNAALVFDPTYPDVDHSEFIKSDWKDFHGEVKEPLPPNAPQARGKPVDLRLFVDSDHAGDRLTRRSRSGHIVHLNMAPIDWLSKKQATCETSVFGAEFAALKVAIEAVRGIRHKLRMMGIEITGPTYACGDNMSVIHNTQRPESVLKKKSNSTCYHAIRESVAMGETLTAHIRSEFNPADICTKVISNGNKRASLIRLILYFLADYR